MQFMSNMAKDSEADSRQPPYHFTSDLTVRIAMEASSLRSEMAHNSTILTIFPENFLRMRAGPKRTLEEHCSH